MSTNARRAAFILTLAFAAPLHSQPSDISNSDVTFEPVWSLGCAPVSGTLSIWSQTRGTVYEKPIQGEVSVKLPYGDYSVVFNNIFFHISETVAVDRPKSLVVLLQRIEDFVYDSPPMGPSEVFVHVHQPPECSSQAPLWVKLVGVYSDYVGLQKVGPDHVAMFSPVDRTFYVALVVDGNGLRAVQPISPKGAVTNVDVTVPECAAKKEAP